VLFLKRSVFSVFPSDAITHGSELLRPLDKQLVGLLALKHKTGAEFTLFTYE